MANDLKQIALRLQPALLSQIDQAAERQGLDRSSFIRLCCSKALAAEGPSKDIDQNHHLGMVDERAREVIRDLLVRVERLERSGNIDPFD